MAEPLSPTVEAAAIQAFDKWAEPQIAAAGWLQRGAIKDYVDSHKQMIIEAIGPAIIEAYEQEKKASG